jgi:hypothetical protein
MLAASSTVTTVTMHADLGKRVRRQLEQHGIRTGPIALHARANRWTFLVHPDIPDDINLYAALFRMSVSVARPTTPIALPAPTSSHLRSWIHAPTNGHLPAGTAVVDAARACGKPAVAPAVRGGTGVCTPHARLRW